MGWALPEGAVLGVFGTMFDPASDGSALGRGLGPETAASVREASLFDVLDVWSGETVLSPGGRRVLVFAPADAGPWFDARVPEAFALQPQEGANPGESALAFFRNEFADGASKVVLIGPDTPTLDPSIVVSAFLCLDGRDVVIGPGTDGGIYLIGCRGEAPPVFEGLDWTAPGVLPELIDRLNATGLTLAVLPPWYVVNSADAWRALCGHLRALRRAGMKPGLPRTEALTQLPLRGRTHQGEPLRG